MTIQTAEDGVIQEVNGKQNLFVAVLATMHRVAQGLMVGRFDSHMLQVAGPSTARPKLIGTQHSYPRDSPEVFGNIKVQGSGLRITTPDVQVLEGSDRSSRIDQGCASIRVCGVR